MKTNKRIFISYSWSSASHVDWVLTLANRLMSDGVDVIIDKWNLKSGQDKYDFMESMVKSSDIDKVLMILDKAYAEKANSREGGVGTEAQILSPEIYSNTSENKFIPIIVERDESGKEYMPKFLSSRLYIDLSNSDRYEEYYDILLRDIYQRPLYSKPKIGNAPTFLFEENPVTYKTTFLLRGFDEKINKNPNVINSLLKQFLNEFEENLKDFPLNATNENAVDYGKIVYDNLTSYIPLRNDFIGFFEKIVSSGIQFDIDILIKFLERLESLKSSIDGRRIWGTWAFDNYKFIIHELFIYLITIGLKHENYYLIEELLYSDYFIKDTLERREGADKFTAFYNYIKSMDEYYEQRNGQEYFSSMADIIIQRIPEGISKQMLVEADLLCHYVGVLNNLRWFPILYIYGFGRNMEIFKRIPSQRHFIKIKRLLNVENATELKSKLDEMKQNYIKYFFVGYERSFDHIIPLYELINTETTATLR